MPREFAELKNLSSTGNHMADFVEEFHEDSAFMDNWELSECFRFIADLPYIEDPEEFESIQRPSFTYSRNPEFRDCDDKAIALGTCLYRRGIPFYFVAVSEEPREDYHHVIIKLHGEDLYLDCTYPENQIWETNTLYKQKVISRKVKQ